MPSRSSAVRPGKPWSRLRLNFRRGCVAAVVGVDEVLLVANPLDLPIRLALKDSLGHLHVPCGRIGSGKFDTVFWISPVT